MHHANLGHKDPVQDYLGINCECMIWTDIVYYLAGRSLRFLAKI